MRLHTVLVTLTLALAATAAPAGAQSPPGFGAPAEDLQRAAAEVLRARYGQSSLRTGTTGYGTPFWNLSTNYREYRLDGKRLRSRCSVHCFVFKQFPRYVDLSVSTDVEKHDLRSTFHGFPSWGWHREQGAYLAHEIIEDIVRGAAVPEGHMIRLRTNPPHEEELRLIEARG